MTLGLGWLVWAIVLAAQGRGQTPAKQILKMRVVKLRDGKVATFGTMALREIVAKWLVGLLIALTIFGWILYFWLVWDKNNQELWDKISDTVVVDDPEDLLDPTKTQQGIGQLSTAAEAGTLPPPPPPPPATAEVPSAPESVAARDPDAQS